MNLTPEQQALLNGEKGEMMAKVMKTLVMYGNTFGAERMVPVTSEYGHTVISYGLAALKPVYDLFERLIDAGLTNGQKFTADPRPLDKNVPTSFPPGSATDAAAPLPKFRSSWIIARQTRPPSKRST